MGHEFENFSTRKKRWVGVQLYLQIISTENIYSNNRARQDLLFESKIVKNEWVEPIEHPFTVIFGKKCIQFNARLP